jgi:hypothetical protein
MRPLPVNPFGDRRNKQQLESARAIEQERADKRIEDIWRERVKANVWRRNELKVRKAS